MALKISNDLRDLLYPIGILFTSNKNVNPGLSIGGTWVVVTGDYLLNFITSGTGGAYSGSTNNGTNSADGNTGSTTITEAQMPSHRHDFENSGRPLYWDSGLTAMGGLAGGSTVQSTWSARTTYAGGNQGHVHTLNSHMHVLNLKKLNMYGWIRTA